jgi:methyl-accepting chemotaxis protein
VRSAVERAAESTTTPLSIRRRRLIMDHSQPHADSGMSGGLHETAETAREIAHTLERSANALDTASEKVERVTSTFESARDTLMENARRYPLAAVATAFAIGFVAARMGD